MKLSIFLKIIKKKIFNFLLKLEFFNYFNKDYYNKLELNKENYFFILDLSSFTPNFDVAKNLIYLAIKAKFKKIHIVVIPEMENIDLVLQKEEYINDPNYFRRINIVYPLIFMIKNFVPNLYFPSSRDEAYRLIKNKNISKLSNPFKGLERKFIKEEIFFRFYQKKKYIPKFKANETSINFFKNKIKYNKTKRFISITLRKSTFNKQYNSNEESWIKIAYQLKNSGYEVILIRDFEQYFEENNKSFNYYDEAIFDPQIRLSIYELCELNLGVSNGPFNSFIFFSDSNFICFKGNAIKETDFVRRYGVSDKNIDFQLPFFTDKQKIVYEEDHYEIIKKEINIYFKNNNLKIID